MLQVLRDSMKYLAWILWAVIAVFVLFVFVDFGSSVPPGQQPNRAAATVGDQEITYREFEVEFRNVEREMQARFGEQYSPELAEQLQLPLQALNRVINRKILLAEAESLGLTVGDEELAGFIRALPVFQEGGRFVGVDRYEGTLRRLGFTSDQFESSVREELLVDRVLDALERSVVVAPAEVEERFREQVERAQIRYVALPLADLRADLAVPAEAVQAFFQQHGERYQLPEERVGQYLLVDQQQLRTGIEVTPEEARAFYDEHQEEYRQQEQVRARHVLVNTEGRDAAAARQLAEQARQRIEGGEDFAAVAGELSDDTSKSRGGDLGWFGRGRMVPAFEEAAFGAQPGDLVGPIETQFGFHVLEVTERREERQRPFEEVEGLIRNRLQSERVAGEAEALAKRLAAQLAEGEATPERLQQLAAEHPGVELGTTEPFRAEGPVLPLGVSPGLNTAAFAVAQGGVTEPVRTPRGWVVLRVTEVRAPRLPQLAEVEAQVRADVEEERLAELAGERLEGARQAAGDGGLAAVAEQLGLAVQESQEFGAGGFVGGLGFNQELSQQVFAMEQGAIGGPVKNQQDMILFEVARRTKADPSELASQREALTAQLGQERLAPLLSALVNQRRREDGVHYDRQLLESFGLLEELGGEAGEGDEGQG